jgi:hypothetical protein
MFHESLDRPTFPGRVSTLEEGDDLLPARLDPLLRLDQLCLGGRRSASYSAGLIGCRYGYSPSLKMRVRSTVAKSSEWSIASATRVFSTACLLGRIGESLGARDRSAWSVSSDFVVRFREVAMLSFTRSCD